MLVQFQAIIGPLTAALGLSLVVERVLEFMNNLFGSQVLGELNPKIPEHDEILRRTKDLKDISDNGEYTEKIEEKAQQCVTTLQGKSEGDIEEKQAAKELAACRKDTEWVEAVPVNVVAWEPATPPNQQRIFFELAVQTFGFALGIVLASIAELQLFNKFVMSGQGIDPWLDYVFTGLLIGAGSGPIHVLIRFISERRVPASAEEFPSSEKTQKVTAEPAIAPGADSPDREETFRKADWVPISYEGGVDRTKLEFVHRRRENPNIVIFHHTAMSRRSTFEDVVRVIKSRKDSNGKPWLTGYHCVITEDGGVHPFCRWDRYGSHAAGYNMRSLGISFNGNFETSPGDRFSNHDGRYGPAVPTDEQLRAGARVVALWAHVYGFVPEFGEAGNVIPHSQIAPKTCPGNMFPYGEFERLVKYYYKKWEAEPVINQEIERFRKKPYVLI
jgi:hypothetical protein